MPERKFRGKRVKKNRLVVASPDSYPAKWTGWEIPDDATVESLQNELEGNPPPSVASKIVIRISELVGAK